MSKSDLQWQFLQCLGLLIGYAKLCGYKLTQGRSYASEAANEADGGHDKSTHLHRLAQDLNLFVEGEYITGSHAAWNDLGTYWKSLHPKARWGGDFDHIKDWNHFSFEWDGIS